MKGLYEVNSVEETWALAREFAKELKPGDVVCLEGDLGAGKTTFVQGLAAAMGAKGRVTSPTFCIVQEHPAGASGAGMVTQPAASAEFPTPPLHHSTTIPLLVHMDLYRLSGEDDVLAIGWEDYLARGAVIAVEWPERAGSLIPPQARRISLRNTGEDSRQVAIDSGASDLVQYATYG